MVVLGEVRGLKTQDSKEEGEKCRVSSEQWLDVFEESGSAPSVILRVIPWSKLQRITRLTNLVRKR